MNERLAGSVQSERGRASVLALLSSAAMLYVVRAGPQIFGESSHPAVFYGLLALLLVVATFSLGCAIHLKLLGNKPSKVLHKELEQRVKRFEALVVDIQNQMADYEEQMLRRPALTARRAVECLSYARKVAQAIDARLFEVRELMSPGSELDLIDAYDLLRRKLKVSENSLNSLIDSDPIPALDPIDWEPTLRRLIAQIDHDLRPVAA